MNNHQVWEHERPNIDQVEGELDDLPCSNHPWKGEPELDITKARIENDDLRLFFVIN